ncbi:hypothetical protein NWP96_06545 [Mycoplasmopsis cynos]|nr:hypothetical protein [Mycoplasmopsis cynos]
MYYLLNSKVSEYIKPDEVLIFYDNYSFNIDEVAKSYYVLKFLRKLKKQIKLKRP